MKKTTTLLVALAIYVYNSFVFAGHLTPNLLVSAKLNGGQEVPVVNTGAYGVAGAIINATRDTIRINASTAGLSGPITGAHFHDGMPGMNGPVVTNLTSFVNGNLISGLITGTDITPTLLSKLIDGQLYLNVHTAAHPNGEIRGQMLVETDWGFATKLNGAEEVPSVSTNAYGLGTFNLSHDKSKLKIYVIVQGLSGDITGAHFHMAPKGSNGGVVTNLTSFVSGNVIVGEVAPGDILTDLLAGNIYINVHTAMNPNGEVRGQLMLSKGLMMDSRLDGAQEVPPVTTTAKGVASVRLSSTLDTLYYDVVNTGLSGAITAAHFHKAAPGQAGPPVIDISSNIVGNRIMGEVIGTSLTKDVINSFLSGDMYINVHTVANGGGEIRGQVYRLAREGYSLTLEGGQEVPRNNSMAKGSGIVSVDRDQTNAHFMISVEGLTSALSGAHFHNAKIGQNGGVVFDLTPFFSKMDTKDSAFGYWRNTDSPSFTTGQSVRFRNDSIYVNIHTPQFPNGEVRGQVIRGASPSSLITATEENVISSSFEVSPNPTNDIVQVVFNATASLSGKIIVSDLVGQEIMSEPININAGNNAVSVSLNSLNSGIYYLSIRNAKGSVIRKIAKN